MTTQSTSKAPRKRVTKRGASLTVHTNSKNSILVDEVLQGRKPVPLDRSEVISLVCGVLLLALSFFTLLSLISHLFTGGMDQKLFEAGYTGVPMNWAGYVGAWWSKFWITENFGIGAFFIPIFLFAASFKLLDAFHVRLWKWFVNCTFLLCWASVAAAFFFTSYFSNNPDISYISPGGYHGMHVVELLEHICGWIGAFLIILLTFLAYLSYLSAETIRFIKRLMHPKQLAHDFSDAHPRITRVFIWIKHVLTPKRLTDEDVEEENEQPLDDATDAPVECIDLTDTQEEEPAIPSDIPVALVAKDEEPDWIITPNIDVTKTSEESKTVEGSDKAEFTIEQPTEEEIADESRQAELEPYDPKLDLENYHYPTLSLLKHYDVDPNANRDQEELTRNKDQIVKVLQDFKVSISSIKATVGPTITLYEITPAPGVKISKIRNLEDDIALSLAALGIRIIAPIPGKGTIGIEVPNTKPQIVSMESILNSKKFQETTMELPMAIGKTITNEVFMADLTKMPHLLVAGATGQGKSVGLNAIITSLLYKKHPAELKLVMVDPKKVEFPIYSPI